jgi:hypothetical protein
MRSVGLWQACLVAAGVLSAFAGGHAFAQNPPSIEKLLEDGWEVAGYVSAWENRSLVLFKHKDRKYLVQCSILTDVLRTPRLVTYCYEIH